MIYLKFSHLIFTLVIIFVLASSGRCRDLYEDNDDSNLAPLRASIAKREVTPQTINVDLNLDREQRGHNGKKYVFHYPNEQYRNIERQRYSHHRPANHGHSKSHHRRTKDHRRGKSHRRSKHHHRHQSNPLNFHMNPELKESLNMLNALSQYVDYSHSDETHETTKRPNKTFGFTTSSPPKIHSIKPTQNKAFAHKTSSPIIHSIKPLHNKTVRFTTSRPIIHSVKPSSQNNKFVLTTSSPIIRNVTRSHVDILIETPPPKVTIKGRGFKKHFQPYSQRVQQPGKRKKIINIQTHQDDVAGYHAPSVVELKQLSAELSAEEPTRRKPSKKIPSPSYSKSELAQLKVDFNNLGHQLTEKVATRKPKKFKNSSYYAAYKKKYLNPQLSSLMTDLSSLFTIMAIKGANMRIRPFSNETSPLATKMPLIEKQLGKLSIQLMNTASEPKSSQQLAKVIQIENKLKELKTELPTLEPSSNSNSTNEISTLKEDVSTLSLKLEAFISRQKHPETELPPRQTKTKLNAFASEMMGLVTVLLLNRVVPRNRKHRQQNLLSDKETEAQLTKLISELSDMANQLLNLNDNETSNSSGIETQLAQLISELSDMATHIDNNPNPLSFSDVETQLTRLTSELSELANQLLNPTDKEPSNPSDADAQLMNLISDLSDFANQLASLAENNPSSSSDPEADVEKLISDLTELTDQLSSLSSNEHPPQTPLERLVTDLAELVDQLSSLADQGPLDTETQMAELVSELSELAAQLSSLADNKSSFNHDPINDSDIYQLERDLEALGELVEKLALHGKDSENSGADKLGTELKSFMDNFMELTGKISESIPNPYFRKQSNKKHSIPTASVLQVSNESPSMESSSSSESSSEEGNSQSFNLAHQIEKKHRIMQLEIAKQHQAFLNMAKKHGLSPTLQAKIAREHTKIENEILNHQRQIKEELLRQEMEKHLNNGGERISDHEYLKAHNKILTHMAAEHREMSRTLQTQHAQFFKNIQAKLLKLG